MDALEHSVASDLNHSAGLERVCQDVSLGTLDVEEGAGALENAESLGQTRVTPVLCCVSVNKAKNRWRSFGRPPTPQVIVFPGQISRRMDRSCYGDRHNIGQYRALS